ncbi:LysM peptidoglycan-binding domain-containing protein [Neisseria shayeganii]|uniref:Membrane bound murein transglycosylase n=1 Tax=Neisseria shayeganii 871 TaxID=1032488 RepID=G4CF85_9NEIS|nr:LysM peptidoglycan-binding domain-containing protein [Neisseria shayeganii]EGY53529.1 membrane bound murein transglycosylase [Neisseria shayeganii 871]
MTQIKLLTLALLGLGLPATAVSQTHSPEKIASAMMNLNASALRSQTAGAERSHNNLWSRMRRDFRMSEVNPEIVRRHENYFATRSAYFNRTIERSRPYLYHILSEVEKRNMPAEIALLPFIESAFVTKARSHVGASGLWQFMPATGRQYGLAQNNLYDARHDIDASTNAALNYLEYLHRMFGDWSLALAAYNWGEGNVSRAINRARSQGLEPVYENLRMPNETRNYVPKLLAVRNLVNNPQGFGLTLSHIENKPYFQAVTVSNPMDINAITRLANISHAEFEALNPSAKVPVFLPENGRRKLLLPVGAVNAFEQNLRSAPNEALLSYDILHTDGHTTLSDIADRTGMNISDLRRTNGLSRNNVRAGSRILVARNTSTAARLVSDSGTDDPLGGLIRQTAAAEPVAAPSSSSRIQVARADTAPSRPAVETHPAAPLATVVAARPERRETARPVIQQAAVENQVAAPANAIIQTARQEAPQAQATWAANSTAGQEPDPLMALANASAASNPAPADAAALVQDSLAQSGAEENRRQAAARAAAERQTRQEAQPNRQARQQAAATHRVASGDTLHSIARRYHISTAELRQLNRLNGNSIRTGQVLKVAGNNSQAQSARNNNTSRQAANNRNANSRQRQTSYTVRSGDTLQSIARRHNVSVNDLKRTNNLRNNTVRPGQKLRVTTGA